MRIKDVVKLIHEHARPLVTEAAERAVAAGVAVLRSELDARLAKLEAAVAPPPRPVVISVPEPTPEDADYARRLRDALGDLAAAE